MNEQFEATAIDLSHDGDSALALQNQIAIVTGSARGIGRAIAVRLAKAGAIPVINYLAGAEKATETLGLVQQWAPRSVSVGADVRQPDDVARMVDSVMATFGRIDILVNNAGIARDGFLHKSDEAQWRGVIETNLIGAYNVTRRVIPHMRAARRGRVINLTSVIGFSGNLGQTNYAASKAGLVGFTRSLALESAAVGIRVNAVAPGFVETAMLDAIPPELRERTLARIPIGRFAKADEIAEVVAFLAGPASEYITGQVIHVNGGLYL
jgi:3-oxoacyl-[acyl-carrier protein] reductase